MAAVKPSTERAHLVVVALVVVSLIGAANSSGGGPTPQQCSTTAEGCGSDTSSTKRPKSDLAGFEEWARETSDSAQKYVETDKEKFMGEDSAVGIQADGCGDVLFVNGNDIQRFNSTGDFIWRRPLHTGTQGKKNFQSMVAVLNPNDPGKQVVGVITPLPTATTVGQWRFSGFKSDGEQVFSKKMGGSDTYEGVETKWLPGERIVKLLTTNDGQFVVVVGRPVLPRDGTTRLVFFDGSGTLKGVKAHGLLPRPPQMATIDDRTGRIAVVGGPKIAVTDRAGLKAFVSAREQPGVKYRGAHFDGEGNLYAIGTQMTQTGPKMYVVKLTPAGAVAWEYTSPNQGNGDSVHVDAEDNVIVTGTEQLTQDPRRRVAVRIISRASGAALCNLIDQNAADPRDAVVSGVSSDNSGRLYVAGKRRSAAGEVTEFVTYVNATRAGCPAANSMAHMAPPSAAGTTGCNRCNVTCTACAGGPNRCTRCRPGFRYDAASQACRPRPWMCGQVVVTVKRGKVVVRWRRSNRDVAIDSELEGYGGQQKWILDVSDRSTFGSNLLSHNISTGVDQPQKELTAGITFGKRYWFRVRSVMQSSVVGDNGVVESVGDKMCSTAVVVEEPAAVAEGCTSGQKKCYDGLCYASDATCAGDAAPTCADGESLCDSGSCAASCEAVEYNGCATTKVLCADGRCVGNQQACSNGCTGDGEERCYDDSCAPFGTCPTDPTTVKAEASTVKVSDTGEGLTSEVDINDTTGSSLGKVELTSDTFSDTTTSNINLEVSPVADSVISQASNRNSESTSNYVENRSPVIDLKFTDETTGASVAIASSVSIHFNATLTGTSVEKLCLAYIDETTMEWKCEDSSLTVDPSSGLVVGKTTHFTKFGIVASGTISYSTGSGGKGLGAAAVVALVLGLLCVAGAGLVCCNVPWISALIGVLLGRRDHKRRAQMVVEMENVAGPTKEAPPFSPKIDRPSPSQYTTLVTQSSSQSLRSEASSHSAARLPANLSLAHTEFDPAARTNLPTSPGGYRAVETSMDPPGNEGKFE